MQAEERSAALTAEHPPALHYAALGEHLIERLRGRLPEYVAHLIGSGRIAVCIVSAPEPRIYVEDFADRSWTVVLHEDLPALLYRLTRAAISTLGFSQGDDVNDAAVQDADLVQILANILWWYRETGLVFGPEYPIGPLQIKIANVICVEAETFLMAHEISHILLYPARGVVVPEELIERLMFGLPKFGPEGVDAWDEEFLADACAVEIVMGLAVGQVENIGAVNQLRYAGVEWMLILTKALQALGFDLSTRHPPAQERLENVRQHMQGFVEEEGVFEAIRLFPNRFEAIIDRAVAVLVGDAPAARDYDDDAQALVARLERALDAAARSTPPNYLDFYGAMNTILATGYHHRLIPRLQALIDGLRPADPEYCIQLEFREHMGQDLTDDDRQRVQWFRQFKLIIGYFQRQANPMGSYMQAYIQAA